MAVDDVAKLIIVSSSVGGVFRPGLHFQSTVQLNSLQSLIDAWQSACQTQMLACRAGSIALIGYEVQDKKPGTASSIEEVVSPPLAGTAVGEALPWQDAVVFSYKSALKSRRSRGRTYWPGATEDQQNGGDLQPLAVTAYQAFRDAIVANFVGQNPVTGWRLVTYSPQQLEPPKAPPPFKPRSGVLITPVTTIEIDTVLRTQRRRQKGVGQ